MSSDILYSWPAAARFGRQVPKTKFYEQTKIPAPVKDHFVDEVQRITWAYKLAETTVHLLGDPSIPEIQVFVIDAKSDEVSNDVLAAIDKAVRYPIIFELNHESAEGRATRMVAAHKRTTPSQQAVGDYFTTAWLDADAPRTPLPTALDLPTLYAALLTPILPVPPRPGERLSDTVDRVARARRLERAIDALEKRLRNEPQFNRKVGLRRELRNTLAELDALNTPKEPATQETQWTN